MKTATFYVPVVRDSDKKPHSPATWIEFDRLLVERCGGFTRLPSVYGEWGDASDISRPYLVALPDSQGLADSIVRDLVYHIRREFGQRAVFVVYGTADILD